MLVTHANIKGFGLTPLSGARHGYMPPLLKTKQAHVFWGGHKSWQNNLFGQIFVAFSENLNITYMSTILIADVLYGRTC